MSPYACSTLASPANHSTWKASHRIGESRIDLVHLGPASASTSTAARTAASTSGSLRTNPRSGEKAMRRPATPSSSPSQERRRRRRHRRPVARVEAGDHVEQRGRVPHRPRHRPGVRQRPERARRIQRDQPVRRLERDRAGERRRGCGPIRRRRCRPTTVPCRAPTAAALPPLDPPAVMVGIPRVAGGAVPRRVGDALPRVLRRRRLAEDDGARLPQPRDARRVLVPRARRVDQRAAAQRRPAAGPQGVLDRGRDAVAGTERLSGVPARLRLLGGRERALAIHQHEGVHPVVVGVDRVQRGLGGLDRRDASCVRYPSTSSVASGIIGAVIRRRLTCSRASCPPR